jgi:hypothetical protein
LQVRRKGRRMKIYIAGKITGEPNYKEKFDIAATSLEAQGHIVLNPAELPEGMLPADYMRICFAMIDTADAIYLLKGWYSSSGASIERNYAMYTGKSILTEGE